MTAWWDRARQRLQEWLQPPTSGPAGTDTLLLSVSDLGWQGKLLHADGRAAEALGDPASGLEDVQGGAVEVLRRAVRSIPLAMRGEISSVSLMIADPAVVMVDNRTTRIAGNDPVRLGEAGAHLTGGAGAIGGFQPFGTSSEHEAVRGFHAFASMDQARDWLAALDTLAARLVRLAPADASLLASAGAEPFLALDVGARTSTLVLADPVSGAIAVRRLGIGVVPFASALAEATSISLRDALAGLERRCCLPPATSSPVAVTGTGRALEPLLQHLRAELQETLDYFVHHRLSEAPRKLLVCRHASRIQGLDAWLGEVLTLPVAASPDWQATFVADAGAGTNMNLLDGSPKGLLRLGRVDYTFTSGRFASTQAEAARPGVVKRLNLPLRLLDLPAMRLALTGQGRAASLGLGAVVLLVALEFAPAAGSEQTALEAFAAAVAGSATSRATFSKAAAAPAPDASADALFWSDKFLALARAAPPAVQLTRVAAAPGGAIGGTAGGERLVIEGVMPSGPADPVGVVADLVARLHADPPFMRLLGPVGLEGIVAERGVVRFTIGAALAPRALPGLHVAGR